jgi:hypothetical protein
MIKEIKVIKHLKKLTNRTEKLPGILKLRKLTYLFKSFGNPIYVWEAYATCREYKINIPNWILEYFDSCTEKLMKISPSQRASDKVYQALKFNDKKRSPFTRRQDVEIAIDITIHACDLKDNGKKLTEIYDELAEKYSVSEKTVERHYQKYKEIVKAPLP